MRNRPIAVVLTDTHLKKDNLDLVYDIFRQAMELAIELGVRRVFHAGDFFTNRIGQNLSTLLVMKRVLDLYRENKILLTGIAGNHDKTDQDSPESYLDVFEYHPNFELIREYSALSFAGDISVSFLPFFTDSFQGKLKKLRKEVKDLGHSTNILITHHAFNGVRNNDGSVVEDSNTTKSVKWWDKVLVGHYHDSSIVGDNVHYIGSAYQCNFGENIDDKGFTILNSDGSLDFEPSDFPKYIKIKLSVNDDVDVELEMLDPEKDKVRFVFEGDKSEIHLVDQSKLDQLGVDCKFELNDINEEILKVENGELQSLSKKSIFKYFFEYCKIQEIDSKKRSKGLKILKNDEIQKS